MARCRGRTSFYAPGGISTLAQVAAAPPAVNQDILADFAKADGLDTIYSWNSFIETYRDQRDHGIVKLAMVKRENLRMQTEVSTRRLNRDPWMDAQSPNGQREADLSEEQRKLLQEALVYMGHEVGAIDGNFGPRTRSTIAAARLAVGLTPGTVVDMALLRTLPDAPAMKDMQTGKAKRVKYDGLPLATGPRLKKVFHELGTKRLLWGYYKGHLYVAVDASSRGGWNSALRDAKRAGSHSATIESADENRFIYDLFMQDEALSNVTARAHCSAR
jgi:peptidoglycan hydrolase-like protein with peptidoglycan-binding domain